MEMLVSAEFVQGVRETDSTAMAKEQPAHTLSKLWKHERRRIRIAIELEICSPGGPGGPA